MVGHHEEAAKKVMYWDNLINTFEPRQDPKNPFGPYLDRPFKESINALKSFSLQGTKRFALESVDYYNHKYIKTSSGKPVLHFAVGTILFGMAVKLIGQR
eukprot:TRINITY_DN9645_c0_g1_i1.p1 TRINITY_DN9645_c0_g1~~TRINITY_DN9645_c0_g1_i1.p1  ORF type:complete len:100 (-),score=40.38 TRINITY_DN9645_c0_g1_i1:204-503(-)